MSQILYIEPDLLLARSFRLALEQAGHQVTHFRDASEAMRNADQRAPDALILELQLIGHNGVDFLYEWRSYSEWQSIPVIVLSVLPPHEAVIPPELWSQLGLTAYLYKPHTTLAQLVATVRRALQAHVQV